MSVLIQPASSERRTCPLARVSQMLGAVLITEHPCIMRV